MELREGRCKNPIQQMSWILLDLQRCDKSFLIVRSATMETYYQYGQKKGFKSFEKYLILDILLILSQITFASKGYSFKHKNKNQHLPLSMLSSIQDV